MKTTKILFFVAITGVLLSACKKDDNDLLNGKWKLDQAFNNDVEYDLNDCQKQSTVQFKSNGEGINNDYDFNCNVSTDYFDWHIVNNDSIIFSDFDNRNLKYHYSIDDGMLTLIIGLDEAERNLKSVWCKVES